jgi:hypothetical protein
MTMETQEQEGNPDFDRPSFFGMPRGLRFWTQVGPRFWTGAVYGFLNGIWFGLMTGVAMVLEWGVITPENDGRLVAIALILLWLSMMFAQWRIGRIEGREHRNP